MFVVGWMYLKAKQLFCKADINAYDVCEISSQDESFYRFMCIIILLHRLYPMEIMFNSTT